VLISCCDDCVPWDLFRFKLVTPDQSDYLTENGLTIEDVELFTVLQNTDTIYINSLEPDFVTSEPNIIVARITENFEKIFFEIQGQVKDSIVLNLNVDRSNRCCTSITTIKSVEYKNQTIDFERLSLIEIIIE
jgi:hypothetical protein